MSDYKEKVNQLKIEKVKEMLKELPSCYTQYFNSRRGNLSESTFLSYTYKFKNFLDYLHQNHEHFKSIPIKEITIEDFKHVNNKDMIAYSSYIRDQISDYVNSKKNLTTNSDSQSKTVDIYIAAIASFWQYLIKNENFESDPTTAVERHKEKMKKLVTFKKTDKINEEEVFLTGIDKGEGLTDRQKLYNEKNQIRDLAICILLLDTGIRVSELVGINIDDLNFDSHSINVDRKGGDDDIVFISDYCETYLYDYLDIRKGYKPSDDEKALFLNRDGKRMGVRSIEKMVAKYRKATLPLKKDKITPHKFRTNYATTVLKETGNISLVCTLLNHKSISTTQAYYSRSDMSDRKNNRNIIFERQNGKICKNK